MIHDTSYISLHELPNCGAIWVNTIHSVWHRVCYILDRCRATETRVNFDSDWENQHTWWRHQMDIFFVLLALCGGNSPVTGEFPAQRPVTQSFDVFFYLILNKRLKINNIYRKITKTTCRQGSVWWWIGKYILENVAWTSIAIVHILCIAIPRHVSQVSIAPNWKKSCKHFLPCTLKMKGQEPKSTLFHYEKLHQDENKITIHGRNQIHT